MDEVDRFLQQVVPERRRDEALLLDPLFREVTGWTPRLWGSGIVGYGSYHYRYATGREGDWLATGFAPRKAHLVVHILPGYTDFSAILDRLGPHRAGKSCLYITRLDRIDMTVLRELVAEGLRDLAQTYPVSGR